MRRNIAAERRPLAGVSMRVLSQDGVDDIHLATLEVLAQAGVFVESDDALDVLADGGCRVDRATKMVRVPSHVVEDAVRSAPPTLVLHGRDRARDVVVDRGRVVFTSFGEGIFVIDPVTGERREPCKNDVAASAAAIDSLDGLGVCNRALGAHDVPQQVAALHTADAILRNTTKHVLLGPQNGFLAERIVGLQAAILGSADAVRERPLVTFTACPVSPLKLARDCCEVILAGARSGVGVNVVSMAMAGGSAPITLAGTLVTHNAEVLAGITLAQLAERGAPVVYGSVSTGLDLRLASASVGSPELAHHRRSRAAGSALPPAELRRRRPPRQQAPRRAVRPREDTDRHVRGDGRRESDRRRRHLRVGAHLRLRPAGHGRGIRRHDRAVRGRHPRG